MADEEIARIASRQHGVVTRTQMIAAGVSPAAIRTRTQRGSLQRVHRGVFRVGHSSPSVLARYMAAVLASGLGAVLAGRAAGYLLGLIAGTPPPPTAIAPSERTVRGVQIRSARRGVPTESTIFRGIPVTTVARTLVDLAAELPTDGLALAVHRAAVRHRTAPREVEAVLSRRPNAKGAGTLRAVLRGDARVTLSRLERCFLDRLGDAHLPLPQTNIVSAGFRVDCRWPDRRLTIELDGYRYHHTRHAWELDRRRERVARAQGDEFRRYTYGDVLEHPLLMMRELTELLGPDPPG